ncbi:AAA family ATPase [Bradyrhizobium sp. Gha]|uniref:AAA family ATPase n=1 Tax=Bradyrhizobium sp. Gha TaxID=1855318 RepID=UPI0008E57A6B|nr:AAA family ATPase [Bradyrhizobium sp. Gha]SFI40169.1 AAA domain-containing protein, putative AbiEii toxin, Type IV TA system [Bradyrhizobium sp. Gha]
MPDIKLPSGLVVPGDHPLAIIGPNGVGKTRLGVSISQNSDGERIAALRNVEIPDIPMQRLAQASQNVRNVLNEMMSQHWRQSYELQNLLSEILAEDRERAVGFRTETLAQRKPSDDLVYTRLDKVVGCWNRHFPNRQIKIDYEPVVERKIGSEKVTYPIARMSEGERTALYLAARVVSCTRAVIVVDEPESFFHPLLARALWDDLEDLAPNTRFVYITHDIPFALSRRRAQFAIARSETTADLLPPASALPADLVAQVFGAASFSVTASRLVFCEGKPDSYDLEILSAWHDCPRTAVVATGGCHAVRECVSVFRSGVVTGGLEAVGYIDRDGQPDSVLNSHPHVKAHPVFEIEGFICLEAIFKAIAKYTGISEATADDRYRDFITTAKASFRGVTLHKEILSRSKLRAEVMLVALMNPIKPDPDLAKVRTAFEVAAPVGGWQPAFATIFTEEGSRLQASLTGAFHDFIRDFPSKSYYSLAAQRLDMTPDAVVRLMCQALKITDKESAENKKLVELRDVIVTALTPFMWPRKVA